MLAVFTESWLCVVCQTELDAVLKEISPKVNKIKVHRVKSFIQDHPPDTSYTPKLSSHRKQGHRAKRDSAKTLHVVASPWGISGFLPLPQLYSDIFPLGL